MAAKACYVLFASALLVQAISGQNIGNVNSIVGTALAAEEIAAAGNALACGANLAGGLGVGAGALGYPGNVNNRLAANSFVPTSGGGFAVTSFSPIAPTGIMVVSENAIEGALAVNGEMPFLGAVALEGALPSAGAGGINYGCGNGAVAILSEGIAPAAGPAIGPLGPAAGIAPGRFGFGSGLAGPAVAGLGAPGLGLGVPGLGLNGLAGPGCGSNRIF